MRRRDAIILLDGAAHAQEPDWLRRLGVLMSNAESDPLGQSRTSAFRQELQELVGRKWAI